MKGILITGGEKPDFDIVKYLFSDEFGNKSYVCAADSGLDYCLANSIQPNYILGDMDSLSDRAVLEGFPDNIIEEHSSEKDFTDSELGLDHLKNKGCSEIIMIGGGGGRLDHLLALVTIYDKPNPPDLWFTANEKIVHISDTYSGIGSIAEMISLFPVGTQECTMSSNGLKWPLDNLHWNKGDSGISNRLETDRFSIKMKTGCLILIRGLVYPLQSL